MSQVKIQGNASGTGIFTVAAPNSNTDRTLTLPDSTGTIATAESTLSQFNVSGSAPVYACRAWVNFNGTGTVAIRASGNVTSITDNNTGEYTVNFTTALADANYSAVITCADGGNGIVAASRTLATTTCGVGITNATVGRVDSATVSVSIFR
jgi:hypothetical protein